MLTCLDSNVKIDNYFEELGVLPVIDNQNSFFRENILFNITDYVVYKLLPRINCCECSSFLLSTDEHCYSRGVHKLTIFKNRGGLHIPSSSVFQIIKETKKKVKVYSKDIQALRKPKILYVRKTLFGNLTMFPNLKCNECDIDKNSKIDFLNLICKLYLKIGLYSLERQINDRVSIRNRLLKIVLFKNL